MIKTKVILNIDREVVKDLKITMANLYISNQSQLIEDLIKEWVVKNSK
jgi:hypothetical protein